MSQGKRQREKAKALKALNRGVVSANLSNPRKPTITVVSQNKQGVLSFRQAQCSYTVAGPLGPEIAKYTQFRRYTSVAKLCKGIEKGLAFKPSKIRGSRVSSPSKMEVILNRRQAND